MSNTSSDIAVQGPRIKWPRKFAGLFHYYRYKVSKSGRGAGKSWQFARALLILGARKKLLIVCAREVMESIRDSVHRLLSTQIEKLGFSDIYHVMKYSIVCKLTGTEFIFKGLFNNRSAESLKSLEDADILWIEEAQSVSNESVELVLPSIRKPGSEIWVSMNGRFRTDPIYRMFYIDEPPPKTLIINVSWRDNEYFTEELNDLRLLCLRTQPERYPMIWEGHVDDSNARWQVLPYSKLLKCVDAHEKLGLDVRGVRDAGLDVADEGPDKNAYAYRIGPLLCDVQVWSASHLHKTAGRADSLNRTLGIWSMYYDANGVGAGIRSDAERMGTDAKGEDIPDPGAFIPFKSSKIPKGADRKYIKTRGAKNQITNGDFFRDCGAQAWWNLRLRMNNTLAALEGDETVDYDRCLFISSQIDNLEKLLDQLSQCVYDDTSKLKIDKNPDDIDSPDMADAVVMAYFRDCKRGLAA